VDRPFLGHVLDHLLRHGVDEVLLSSPYLEERFAAFLRARTTGPRVTWITESSPLGTGGAVANAAGGLDGTFLVLNGDILSDLDLSALVARHRKTGATVTLTVSPVEDARPFGLVSLDDRDRVREFREKPVLPVPGLVNAGTYVLEPHAVEEVPPDRPVSIEREVFPGLIDAGEPIYGFVSSAYWIDVGTPAKYLRATFDALEGRIRELSYTAPFVDPEADVSLRSHLGRWVVAAPGSMIGANAEVEDSVLLAEAVIEQGAKVRESILGPGAWIGAGAIVHGAVLAEGSAIAPGAVSEGARVGVGETLTA
jgi:mannose-1-phosphate guanylyltransferase